MAFIPASKKYVNTAVRRIKEFIQRNKVKCVDDLARLDGKKMFYDDRRSYVSMRSIAKGSKRDLTLSYNSCAKGRVIDISIEQGSMNYVSLVAKTSYPIPGFSKNPNINGGIFEQYRKVLAMPMHTIPVIRAELEALL